MPRLARALAAGSPWVLDTADIDEWSDPRMHDVPRTQDVFKADIRDVGCDGIRASVRCGRQFAISAVGASLTPVLQ
jgi:hypothetical protein